MGKITPAGTVRMPPRYDWLYDGVLILLVAGVLINLWINIFSDNSCQCDLFHQGAFALISLAFLAVLGLFYFYRDKIKDVAGAMNKLLDEEMTPSQ
jgi:hypothetical protein